MIIKCRPFYLPREYTAILLVSVYIPPNNNNSNRNDALNELYQHISEQQTAHPDAFLIIAGDFNHADLKSVFPKIHQHINFPTRGNNILDFVYTTQRGAYKGKPQGCVLSPLLFTLLTHDCTPSHNSILFIKFADDTTVVGLISNRDETNYRTNYTQHVPLTINGVTVERVSSTKFLGVHITEDLSWTDNTAALAKKSQQRLYFLHKLRRARAPPPIMYTFYRGTIESILTSCITVWYGACNASCRKTLQRIVRAAEKIIGVSLPSLQDIYGTRLTRKALCIAGDPTHPSHSFFSLLPSGRRLRSLQARTSRLKDSFIHQAVRKLNSLPNLPPRPSSASGTTEL
uniref:Reverse transcriptase domain-containing protein n=1 Tax=Cyprinus carpio TaxID=7962 RepID=A0A8C1UAT8_CYPCA